METVIALWLLGATVGLLLGTAAKMAIAFGMVGFFLFARFL